MSSVTVDALRAEYMELHGNHARGSKCMSAPWLRERIKVAKARRGPPGPQGKMGKTGKKGNKGNKGDQGKQGAPAPPPQDTNYDDVKQLRNPSLRVNQKIVLAQYAPGPLLKLKEAAALLEQAKTLRHNLSGVGGQITSEKTRFDSLKIETETLHDAINAVAVGNKLAQQYLSIDRSLSNGVSDRLAGQFLRRQQELKAQSGYHEVEMLLAEKLAGRKTLKASAVLAQDKLVILRRQKDVHQRGYERVMGRAKALETEADGEMQAMDEGLDFAPTQEIGDSMEFEDSQNDYDDESDSVSDSGAGTGIASDSNWSAGSSWVYIDSNETVQGPFDTAQMKAWFNSGQMSAETQVKPFCRRFDSPLDFDSQSADAFLPLKQVEIFANEGNRPAAAAAGGGGAQRRAPRLSRQVAPGDVRKFFGRTCKFSVLSCSIFVCSDLTHCSAACRRRT